ncbi:MAG: hypothetical protein RIB46_20520 [Pseudomonadales bacterium]
MLPLSPGRAERHGFEYFRYGTLSLYAAFNTRTGEVLGKATKYVIALDILRACAREPESLEAVRRELAATAGRNPHFDAHLRELDRRLTVLRPH